MMSLYTESIENKLKELFELSYDTEKGFKKAAEDVENTRYQNYFKRKAAERESYRKELLKEFRVHHLELEEKEDSLGGAIHRASMEPRTFFSVDKEELLFAEVRNREQHEVEAYDELLALYLPTSTAIVLRKQRNAMKASHDKAERMETIL